MTVTELIEWLKTQPQDHKMVIQDADTGWFLDLHVGISEDPMYHYNKLPDNLICVSGEYGTEYNNPNKD